MTKPVEKIDQRRQVSSKATLGILLAAEQYPLPIDEIMETINLDPVIFRDVDTHIPHSQFCELWQEFVSRSGDSYIGLSLARLAQPAAFDVLGYAAINSPNVGEALKRLGRYIRLIYVGAEVTFEMETQEVARITHTLAEFLLSPPAVFDQWVIASLFLLVRRMTGLDWVPIQVGFQHPKPKNTFVYSDFFQAPVVFDQPTNELKFNCELLQLPLQASEPRLCGILDCYAKEMLTPSPQSKTFLSSVRRLMSQELKGGDLSLVSIANTLGYAPRTLQRKLQETGTSYQKLLDEMRQELSVYYLREDKLSINEVAFLLGFSEASAFHRAFRRWTGVSPRKFRRTAS